MQLSEKCKMSLPYQSGQRETTLSPFVQKEAFNSHQRRNMKIQYYGELKQRK